MQSNEEFRPFTRETAREDIRKGHQWTIDRALTLLGATIGTDAEGDCEELSAALAYCEEVFIQMYTPKAANGIVCVPDGKGYMPMYSFGDDPDEYLHSNYDPAHDPFADKRSIQAEYEGSLPAASMRLIAFAKSCDLPITFLPASNR